jgi:hypothetical protein
MPVRDECPACRRPELICNCLDEPRKITGQLDYNTHEGRKSVEDEKRAVAQFEAAEPEWKYIHTSKTGMPAVNAVLLKNGELAGLAYMSCRYDMDYALFTGQRANEWLVTWRKIKRAATMCREMEVRLIGFLYLVPDGELLVRCIYDPLASPCWRVARRREYSGTRRTVNDPTPIERLNIMLDMSTAKRISPIAALV